MLTPSNIATSAGLVKQRSRPWLKNQLGNRDEIDATQIQAFLTALGYQDGDTLYFRAINHQDASNSVCTFPVDDRALLTLRNYQVSGYGVYLVINGGGQRDADVEAGRAVWFEHDDMPVEEQLTLWQRFRLPEPTIQVNTGGKSIHNYWVFDKPMPVAEWRVLQADLLEWVNADRTIKNPSRVMRLPGTIHQKTGKPCQIATNSGQRYSFTEIRAIVPEQVQPEPLTQTHREIASPVNHSHDESASKAHDENLNPIPLVNCISKKHRTLIADGVGEGSRNSSGAALARDLIGTAQYLETIGQAYEPGARSLFDDYCQRCTPALDDREAETIWRSAEQDDSTPCLSDDKIQACIAKWQREPNRKAKKATVSKPATKQIGEGDDPEEKTGKQSIADLLLEVATQPGVEYWKTPDGVAYADVLVDGIRQTYPLRRRQFKLWLSHQLHKKHSKQPNSEALQTCLGSLEAKALFDGQERKVWQRLGQADGKIYLDLGTQDWKAVEVSTTGYRVIDSRDCPVRFTRSDGNLPLPIPEPGGNLQDLWTLLPVKAESKPLLLGFLIFCLIPTGDKPILVLSGPKGSGKSTVAQVLKRLVDPGKGALLPAVGDRRQMAVTASNRWLLIFDNLTSLTTEQQDTLCCTSTGAGFSTRTLHTDLDETFVEYTRPQILTSVDLIPTRSDLLDRCVLVGLDRISDDDRLTDEELEERIDSLAPKLLGALLDCVSEGLKNLAATRPGKLPRMASFARFAIAAEPAYSSVCQGFEFLPSYQGNIGNAQTAAIEANPIAAAILEIVSPEQMEVTPKELVEKLKGVSDDPKVQKLTVRSLGQKLGKKGTLRSDLEAVGVEIDTYSEGKEKKLKYLLTRPDQQQNTYPAKPANSTNNSEAAQRENLRGGVSAGQVNSQGKPLNPPNPPLNPPTKSAQGKAYTPLAELAGQAGQENIQLSGQRKLMLGDSVRYVGDNSRYQQQYPGKLVVIKRDPSGLACRTESGAISTWLPEQDLRLVEETQ